MPSLKNKAPDEFIHVIVILLCREGMYLALILNRKLLHLSTSLFCILR